MLFFKNYDWKIYTIGHCGTFWSLSQVISMDILAKSLHEWDSIFCERCVRALRACTKDLTWPVSLSIALRAFLLLRTCFGICYSHSPFRLFRLWALKHRVIACHHLTQILSFPGIKFSYINLLILFWNLITLNYRPMKMVYKNAKKLHICFPYTIRFLLIEYKSLKYIRYCSTSCMLQRYKRTLLIYTI